MNKGDWHKNHTSAIEHYFETFKPRADVPRVSMLVFQLSLSLSLWLETSRTRRHLRGLTDEQLRDVGLSKREAERECERKFYDI